MFFGVGCSTGEKLEQDSPLEMDDLEAVDNVFGDDFFIEEQDVYKIGYDNENGMYYVFWYDKEGILVGVTNSWRRFPTIEKMENGLWRFEVSRGTGLGQEVYFDEENGYLSDNYYYVVGVSEEYIARLMYDVSESDTLIMIEPIFSSSGYELLIDRNLGWVDTGHVEVDFLDGKSLRLIYRTEDGNIGDEKVTWE